LPEGEPKKKKKRRGHKGVDMRKNRALLARHSQGKGIGPKRGAYGAAKKV